MIYCLNVIEAEELICALEKDTSFDLFLFLFT